MNCLTASVTCLHACAMDHWRASWLCQRHNVSKHLSLSQDLRSLLKTRLTIASIPSLPIRGSDGGQSEITGDAPWEVLWDEVLLKVREDFPEPPLYEPRRELVFFSHPTHLQLDLKR